MSLGNLSHQRLASDGTNIQVIRLLARIALQLSQHPPNPSIQPVNRIPTIRNVIR